MVAMRGGSSVYGKGGMRNMQIYGNVVHMTTRTVKDSFSGKGLVDGGMTLPHTLKPMAPLPITIGSSRCLPPFDDP
jgi:hypothetical protein